MRVQFTFVGVMPRHDDFTADLDAVPREDEIIGVPGLSEADTYVRTVIWYPLGDGDDPTPFVYVVVGPKRPG